MVSTRLVIFFRFLRSANFPNQNFMLCFPHFLFDIPSSVRGTFSKYWFPHDLSFFQISRNCKCSMLCFPHFLFDIPSSVRCICSKYWFPQDLSFFKILRNCKYSKSKILFDIMSDEYFQISWIENILFPKDLYFFFFFFEKVNCQNYIHWPRS